MLPSQIHDRKDRNPSVVFQIENDAQISLFTENMNK